MYLNGHNASEDEFLNEVGPFVGFEGSGFLNLLYGLWTTGLGSDLRFNGSEKEKVVDTTGEDSIGK